MKRTAMFICLLMIVFSFTSCTPNPGKTNNAIVALGESEKFSKEEVQAAADCVLKKFKDFVGCDLKKLWYDEEKSNTQVDGYMLSGRGSVNGVDKENVIILFSDFYVDSTGGEGSFNPNFTYTGWNWILIRDSKTGDWRVDDWGY